MSYDFVIPLGSSIFDHMESTPIIQVSELTKKYKNSKTNALNKIGLTINKGEFFGLLGPNGAGKTTFFSMLCGLLHPTMGEVIVDNKSVKVDLQKIKQILGVVPQDIALYPTLSGRDNLLFIGRMYGMRGSHLTDSVDKWLTDLGFDSNRNKPVKTYSGGMARRINFIGGVINHPKILLLDEPTVGIDVHSRVAIMDQLKSINRNEHTTIIYTSHYLEQAEQFCDRVAIIDEGNIITQGSPKELIEQESCKNLEELFIKLTGKKIRD